MNYSEVTTFEEILNSGKVYSYHLPRPISCYASSSAFPVLRALNG